MPKINVYLPDELAEAVKESGIPVSAICQRALEQAVRRITAIRETALSDVSADGLAERFPHLAPRARAVIAMAIEQAQAESAPSVGTGHLLTAMIEEGENLALQVLGAMEIVPAQVPRELARQTGDEPTGPGAAPAQHFSTAAATVLELAVTEATSLGHNYVGCEHLLIAFVTEPDGNAGKALRALGAEPRLTRRAVNAALAGYVHLRAQAPASSEQAMVEALQRHLEPLIERIERLERG
jgi:ATP-dependent Clp protease ATP-binding subunit ClpA